MDKMEIFGRQPRRKFFTTLLTGIAGVGALLLAPKRAGAETTNTEAPQVGPILYHRNEETERYYRTLYR